MRHIRDALMVTRNTRGQLVRRPLSPHIQVYRWPLSMALSILHRVTGVMLAFATLLMTWWLLAAAVSDNAFARAQWFMGSALGLLLLFGWTLALMFHFFTGIRHLFWDAGYGYDPPHYNTSGWAVVIATGVTTILIWIIVLVVW